MKVKVSEAEGPVLDWMVALIEYPEWKEQGYLEVFPHDLSFDDGMIYAPSTDWSQGGPIIEREFVTLAYLKVDGAIRWEARKFSKSHTRFLAMEYGPTPLIAAMRCYVTSKLGDEVDVPEVLCEEP